MSSYMKTLFQTFCLLSCMRAKRSPIAWLHISRPFSRTLSNLARRSTNTSITSLRAILRVRCTMSAVSSLTTSLIVGWLVIFVGALPGLGGLFVLWCFTWNYLCISMFHVTKVQKKSHICKKKDLRFYLNYNLTICVSVSYSVKYLYFPPLGVCFHVHQWSQPPTTKINMLKIQSIP